MARPKKSNSQREAILNHLQTRNSITSIEAINNYGVTRLAAVVFALKKEGYNIHSNIKHGMTRYGEPCCYAEYSLVN